MEKETNILFVDEALERIGDKEIYKEIADYFLTAVDSTVETLTVNIQQHNTAESTRFAHSLKSNCATLGAEKAKSICAELEILCRNANFVEANQMLALLLSALADVKEALQNLRF